MIVSVIGFGSIGARHARVLQEVAERVSVVSRRTIDWTPSYHDIHTMIQKEQPEYVVIANETSRHTDTLLMLEESGYKGKIVIEKPLFREATEILRFGQSFDTSRIHVAYNLRFHPAILKIKQLLDGETPVSAHIYTAQYLPSWRPQSNYANSYSASKQQGGGVIRDLSHELDYLLWLFGDWQSLVASGGKISDLQIDSDDHFSAILRMENQAHVIFHVNYLDRSPRRQIVINTKTNTIVADLVASTVQTKDEQWTYQLARDDTYRSQHLDCMSDQPASACTFAEGYRVMQLIKAMEQSSENKEWIDR